MTRMGPGKHVLDEGSRSPVRRASFWGKARPIAKNTAGIEKKAKAADPIDFSFGFSN